MAEFQGGIVPSLKDEKVVAIVRSEEQAIDLSDSGMNVVCLDLVDKEAVAQIIKNNNSKIACPLGVL